MSRDDGRDEASWELPGGASDPMPEIDESDFEFQAEPGVTLRLKTLIIAVAVLASAVLLYSGIVFAQGFVWSSGFFGGERSIAEPEPVVTEDPVFAGVQARLDRLHREKRTPRDAQPAEKKKVEKRALRSKTNVKKKKKKKGGVVQNFLTSTVLDDISDSKKRSRKKAAKKKKKRKKKGQKAPEGPEPVPGINRF